MLSWLLALALAGPCDLSGAPEDAFEVQAPPRADAVRVLIELWPQAGQEAWTEAMLQAFEARGLAAMFTNTETPPMDVSVPEATSTRPKNYTVGERIRNGMWVT